MDKNLELYYWPTPNGHKIAIFLEETGLPYHVHPLDIGKGEQFKPEFLRISPNNKIPALLDPQGPDGKPLSLFESGAILLYLAEKTGQFLEHDARGRYQTLQWLFFQVASLGPMLGQVHHFRCYAQEKIDYAIDRYTNEAARLYHVMDKQLSKLEHFSGAYSIADMAIYPWIRFHERQGQKLGEFPHLKRWFDSVAARPAVQRGIALLKEVRGETMSANEKEILFGKTQYQRR
ncbi:MAG: glutathione S-transferase N-terminal domain-containing protein [Gammaproteobacteria bacterium]|nr:glutathione S-transferase N-terminal domain-containing protein [Gammaproteobacteria bacterium]